MVEITPFAVDDFAPVPVLVGAGGIDGAAPEEADRSLAPARVGRSRTRQAAHARAGSSEPVPVVIEGSPLLAAQAQAAAAAPLPLSVSITPDPVGAALPPLEGAADAEGSAEPRRRRRRSSASD